MLLFGQKCETFAADLIGLVVVGMEYTYVHLFREKEIYFRARWLVAVQDSLKLAV